MKRINKKEILKYLDSKVYGHTQAKKVLINLVDRAMVRFNDKWNLNKPKDMLIESNNCLLIGDSGTGKTFLLETLLEVVDFPVVKLDASSLNLAGGKGQTCDVVVNDILNYAKGWRKKNIDESYPIKQVLDTMIIFVDEFDKLSDRGKDDDGWNSRVQASFLRLFEGKHPSLSDGMTFIFAGAFTNLEKNIKSTRGIGFTNTDTGNEIEYDDLSNSIIKYGFLPEIVGRLKHIVKLDQLNFESYRQIFNDIILGAHNKEAAILGHKALRISDSEIDEICNKVMKNGTGVRGLKSSISNKIIDLEFENSGQEEELYEGNYRSEDI